MPAASRPMAWVQLQHPATGVELEQPGRLSAGQAVRAIEDDRDGRFQAVRCQDSLTDFED